MPAATHPPLRSGLTRLALAVAAALVLAPAARAQSLQELYQAALGYDATYLSAKALLDSAQYRVDQVKASKLPSIALDASVGRQGGESGARLTSGASGSDSVTNSINGSVSLRQSLYNPANDALIAQTEKGVESSRSDFELAEQDLIVRVAQAYFDVLAAQDALETARTSQKAITEQLASAKRNFEVGTATITDTREAQARSDLARAQEIAAQNDLLAKRIALDQLVGRNGVVPKGLAVPVALPPVMPASVDDWVDKADAEQPNIRKARLGLDVAKLETEKARAGDKPTVGLSGSVGAGYGSTHQNTWTPAIGFSTSGRTTSTGVAIALNYPLFSGFATQNRIKETLLLEDKARNDLEAVRRSVATTTRTAFFGLNSQLEQVKALEAAESSSQLALEATQLGYKVGVRVNLDVLNAQTQLFTTRRDLARARYDVLVNGLKLRQASGQLKADDVNAVNQLLAR